MRPTSITHAAQLRQIIAARRKAQKFSQSELASKVGVTQNRLSDLESGRTKLTVDRLLDLFHILGIELLVQDRGDTPSKGEW